MVESSKRHQNSFEIQAKWSSYSEEEKIIIIRDAANSDPELAIIPILDGITSYQFAVRNEARKGLEFIRLKIVSLLTHPDDKEQYFKGMKTSASVCSRIYSKIKPDMTAKEIGYFFKLLPRF